jgi:hypothetical protein
MLIAHFMGYNGMQQWWMMPGRIKPKVPHLLISLMHLYFRHEISGEKR